MTLRKRRSWLCHLADRAEFSSRFGAACASDREPASLRRRLIERHIARCPACRAEQAANERLVRLLKAMEQPAAPSGLLAAVMARIAAERAQGEASGAAGRAAGVPRRDRRRVLYPGDRLEFGAALCVLALLCGWAGFVGASEWLGGFQHAAFAAAEAGVAAVRAQVREAALLLRTGSGAIPAGLELYAAALFWSAAGIGSALLAPALLGDGPARGGGQGARGGAGKR